MSETERAWKATDKMLRRRMALDCMGCNGTSVVAVHPRDVPGGLLARCETCERPTAHTRGTEAEPWLEAKHHVIRLEK